MWLRGQRLWWATMHTMQKRRRKLQGPLRRTALVTKLLEHSCILLRSLQGTGKQVVLRKRFVTTPAAVESGNPRHANYFG